jgi:hypothetical protein
MTIVDICDVCGGQDGVDLCSSGLGPVSYNRCLECQSRGAEGMGVVCFWLFTMGGPKNAPDHFDKVISYHAGRYVDRAVVSEMYPAFEVKFREEWDEDPELIDDD